MRRMGTSLIEVLIAIFIMALGLVALMCLFPVGAVTMAKGVQNERSAQLAASAASQFRMMWKQMCTDAGAMNSNDSSTLRVKATPGSAGDVYHDVEAAFGPPRAANNGAMLKWFHYAMDDPNVGITQGTLTLPNPLPGFNATNVQYWEDRAKAVYAQSTSSYPVYLDPIGWRASGSGMTPQSLWVGYRTDLPATSVPQTIPRRTLCEQSWRNARTFGSPWYQQFTELNRAQSLRNFCLLDDMAFNDDDPTPKMAGTSLEREAQYSYAFLLRRPMNSDRTNVHVTVVVYFRRPIESGSVEQAFYACNAEGNKITIVYDTATQAKPILKQGSWILDGTMTPEPQGRFYRVEEVVDPVPMPTSSSIPNPKPTMVALDVIVNQPIRRLIADPAVVTDPTLRNIIVLDSVIDVFDKGTTDMMTPNQVN